VDAIADAGADAVKSHTHIAAAESTRHEPWRVKFSRQDASRYDYWKRMEFSPEQWGGLAEHARDRDLLFLSSAFSPEAVELLASLDVKAWKVASGEVANLALLEMMARYKRPVLLSSGMSDWSELDAAVDCIRSAGADVAVLQCATAYPCPPEQVGLNVLPLLRQRYGCWVGLSDHSATIFPSLAAVTMGADVLEVHVTLSREMFGPDVPASVTTTELRQLCEGVRFIEAMLRSPVDKDARANELGSMRALFTKSIVSIAALPKGAVLRAEDLSAKKPGTGLPVSEMPRIVGRRLARSVDADELLTEDHLEPA